MNVSVIDDLGNFINRSLFTIQLFRTNTFFNEINNIHIDEDETLSINLSQYLVDDDIHYGDTHRYQLVSAANFCNY